MKWLWNEEVCLNPPAGFDVSISSPFCCPDVYRYTIESTNSSEHSGFKVTDGGYESLDLAQAACERMLGLLGQSPKDMP